jgi:hypothetical protein
LAAGGFVSSGRYSCESGNDLHRGRKVIEDEEDSIPNDLLELKGLANSDVKLGKAHDHTQAYTRYARR